MADVYERRPCFLARPEWQDIAFTKEGQSFGLGLQTDFSKAMAELPGLWHEFEQLNTLHNGVITDLEAMEESRTTATTSTSSPIADSTDRSGTQSTAPANTPRHIAQTELLWRVQALKDRFREISKFIDHNISIGCTVTEVPVLDPSNPNTTTYRFTSWQDMSSTCVIQVHEIPD